MSAQIVPSQMNEQLFKAKIRAAEKGHELLKRKNDSLKTRLQRVVKNLIERKKQLKDEFSAAYLAIAEAEWSAGDFYAQVRDQATRPSFALCVRGENIAGVRLPTFEVYEIEVALAKIGRSQGGAQIEQARCRFARLLRLIVEIASLQTNFVELDRAIRVTSRRVNALEFVVVPRLRNTVAYITDELDEQAREEKFMLKKVLEHRRREQAERDRLFALKKIGRPTALPPATSILQEETEDDLFS